MPLLSIEFLLFFLAFFPIYWLLKKHPNEQNILLLFSSLGWLYYLSPFFAVSVVVFSLVISVIAHFIVGAAEKGRKIGMWVGITLGLLNLGFFKFNDFFLSDLKQLINDPLLDILMPLGISYYTFQSIAYLVALSRNEPVKLKWYNALLHFSFFLTITAGPIARIQSFKNGKAEQFMGMYEQLQVTPQRNIITPHIALFLVVLGIAKKWWLAAFFAEQWVSPIFENPAQYSLTELMLAIYGYTFQLYFDFSGYTDLVVGLGMLLGFQLPRNFNMPLLAKNLKEFWGKWHISLSTWIRDYIYIPLGGSRNSFGKTQLNLIIAMTLSGVWHGYGWNFFLWGLLHGLGLVALNSLERISVMKPLHQLPLLGKGLSIFATLSFVSFTFITFNTAIADLPLFYQALTENTQGWTIPDLIAIITVVVILLWFMLYPLLEQLTHTTLAFMADLPLLLWIVPLVICCGLIILFAPSGIPGFIYANF